MESINPPLGKNHQWMPVEEFRIDDLMLSIENSLIRTTKSMLQVRSNNIGIKALLKVKEDIPNWINHKNWRENLILMFEMGEVRGSGGAGYRNLYLGFLREIDRNGYRKINCLDLFDNVCKL